MTEAAREDTTHQIERDQQCDLLIRNAYVITMDPERRILANGAVAVTGPVIVEVGRDADLARRYRAARTIDAGGAPVHPGFFDLHLHGPLLTSRGALPDGNSISEDECMTFSRKWSNSIESEDEYAGTLLASLEMLRNGITCFLEPGTVFDTDAAASAIERIGIRASLADPFLWDNPANQWTHGHDRAPATRERARKLLGQELWRNNNPDTLIRGHIALYGGGTSSDELLLEAGAAATDNDTILTQHQNCFAFDTGFEDESLGKHALVHQAEIGFLGPHCVFSHMNFIRDDEAAVLVESGVAIAWNPGNYFYDAIGSKIRPRTPELYRKGVRVGPGSDVGKLWGYGEQGPLGYFVARSKEDFVSVEEILEMATISSADALGLRDRLGSLEAGKRADIVIRTLDVPEAHPNSNPIRNLMLISRGKSVDTVLVEGKILLEKGRATQVDETEVYDLADAAARGLAERVGVQPGPNWPVLK